MSLTYQELIYRAVDQAGRGIDPNTSPLIDLGMLAENLAPHVFRVVAENAARDSSKRALLRASQTIVFTNGVGTIANNALLDYMGDAVLRDTSDFTKLYSYYPEWSDFVQGGDTRLGRFTNVGTVISVVEPIVSYSASSGITANRQFTIPTVPTIPVLQTDPVVIPEFMIDEVVAELAAQVRGEYDNRTKK